MSKFEELYKKLESLDIIQTSIDWVEDLPDEIWEEYSTELTNPVDEDLDIDQHRWYATSISVYEIEGEYLGVEHVSVVFSESMNVEDCYHTLEFYKMKPKKEISFKIK